MTNGDKAKRIIERLVDEMERNVNESSGEELLTEAVEVYGSVENMMSRFAEIVDAAAVSASADEDGSSSVSKVEGNSVGGNVLQWPLDRKRKLLDDVRQIFRDELTAAARSRGEGEDDLDFLIEKYIKLGIIDSEGNITE